MYENRAFILPITFTKAIQLFCKTCAYWSCHYGPKVGEKVTEIVYPTILVPFIYNTKHDEVLVHV